jgi:hypothetical protein
MKVLLVSDNRGGFTFIATQRYFRVQVQTTYQLMFECITQYLLIIMSRFKLNTRINTKDYDISQAESFDMQIFPRSLDNFFFNGKMLKWSLFIFIEKKSKANIYIIGDLSI